MKTSISSEALSQLGAEKIAFPQTWQTGGHSLLYRSFATKNVSVVYQHANQTNKLQRLFGPGALSGLMLCLGLFTIFWVDNFSLF